MFGKIVKSKSTLSVMTAAALASMLLTPAAFAASAGNSFEIPPFEHTNAYYSTPAPTVGAPVAPHRQMPAGQRSTANSSCPGGYTWSDSMAGNGMSIPTPCRS